MNTKFLLIMTLLFLSFNGLACELPKNKKLYIGCSYKCSFMYRLRLNLTALVRGYQLRFVDLANFDDLSSGLNFVDGVLIPGGADIDPEYYLQSITPELAEYTRNNLHLVQYSSEGEYRDPLEFKLVKNYSEEERYSDLPLLGICRGMQMMAISQGIPLYLDLETETGIKNRYYKFDKITLRSTQSLMSSIYGNKKIRGFKLHHQGVRMPYYNYHQNDFPYVQITATSHDGLIAEALEFKHRKALGVQFHPEKSSPQTAFPIFNWFLTKACEYSNLKDKK